MDTDTPVRVLVADDNRTTAYGFAKGLEKRGHVVRVVLNGLAAMDVVREFQPQVVLLDIGMPGMDGCEVTQRIRREPGFEATRIVVISGRQEDSVKAQLRQAGADYYLVKPVHLEEVWSIIERVAQPSAQQ